MGRKRKVDDDVCETNKKKRMCHFISEHREEWPFIRSSTRGKEYFLCSTCDSHFSLASGGRNYIEGGYLKLLKRHASNTKLLGK